MKHPCYWKKGLFICATTHNLEGSKKIIKLIQKGKLPLKVLKFDVIDDKSVKETIEKITVDEDTIDVFMNNDGYASLGPEELSIQELRTVEFALQPCK